MSSAIYFSRHPAKIFELGQDPSHCGCVCFGVPHDIHTWKYFRRLLAQPTAEVVKPLPDVQLSLSRVVLAVLTRRGTESWLIEPRRASRLARAFQHDSLAPGGAP